MPSSEQIPARRRVAGHRGLHLAAQSEGDRRHAPVILAHGAGQTRHSWGSAASELAAMGFYALSFDLRGHGESDWAPDGDYSIDAFVGDLEALLAGFSAPVALVGASLGGAISLIASGEDSGLNVGALVLVDVAPNVQMEGVDRIRAFMSGNQEGFASVAEAAAAVSRYLPQRPRPASHEGLSKNLRRGPDGRLYWHWDPRFQANMRTDVQLIEMRRRMDSAARNISVPTLIVRGKASDVVSREGVEELRRSIPHAECLDVEDAGHMVAGDKNDRFNAAVTSFLSAIA